MKIKVKFSEEQKNFKVQFDENGQAFVTSFEELQLLVNLINGKSAYDLACDEGFKGTVTEWLESLHGERGLPGKDGQPGQPGKDGYTPVKGVDYFDGLPGKDGKDGSDGKDGYTPQKGIDYFDGKDGLPGETGKDGYTPVVGKDFYTEAEKAAFVQAVLAALPVYDGEVVTE